MLLGYSEWKKSLAQKVNQRSPFQLPKAESTSSLRSAGDQLKREKIDCHFFGQQHLPASAAASGEIPCCLRKCPAELQGTQSTEEGLALCSWGLGMLSLHGAASPAARVSGGASIQPQLLLAEKEKRKGARMKLDCGIGTRGMWQEGEECLIWLGRGAEGEWKSEWSIPLHALARTTGKAQLTWSLGD